MGFDISFHPFSPDELREYFFAVLQNPAAAAKAASGVTTNREKQDQLLQLYNVCSMVLPDVRDGDEPFSASIGFAMAAVCGFLHPYWYSRGACISALQEKIEPFPNLLRTLTSIFPDELEGIRDDQNGSIQWNNQVGGCMTPVELPQLQQALEDPALSQQLSDILDDESRHALLQAVRYCRLHGLHLLEASDVAAPVADESVSDFDNFRAGFLGTADILQNARKAPR